MTVVPSDFNQPIVIRIPQVGYDPVKSVVAIALGSNLGDPQHQLETGLLRLHQHPQIEILQVSPCFWTEPVVWTEPLVWTEPVAGPDSVGQQELTAPAPAYLNGAALLATTLNPQQLMQALLDVEAAQGRTRKRKWASRTLDLDILLWEKRYIHCATAHVTTVNATPANVTDECDADSSLPEVMIPHPRLGDRPFVLVPLNALIPDWIVPQKVGEAVGDISVRQLADAAGTHGVDVANPIEIDSPD